MHWKTVGVYVFVALWALPVWAMPSHINVDGVLRDTGGNLLTAEIPITFSIHGAEDGNVMLWEENQSVPVTNGVFSRRLPEVAGTNAFPDGIFETEQAYLQIQAEGQDALPMIALASVPYALHAKRSVSADTALALDCAGCIETPMLSASVTIAASKVTYDDTANGLGATVQDGLDGLFARLTSLTFADLVGGSDAVIAVIADDGFARLSDLAAMGVTGQFIDLQGIPTGLSDGDDDTQLSSADVLGMVSAGGYVTGEHSHNFALPHDHPYVSTAGGTLSGNLAMSGNRVTGLAAPTADGDATTKAYVDAASGGAGFNIEMATCGEGIGNIYTVACTATCPSGMKIINASVACHFNNFMDGLSGEGAWVGTNSSERWSCAKLGGSPTAASATHQRFEGRTFTEVSFMAVFGTIWCITAN